MLALPESPPQPDVVIHAGTVAKLPTVASIAKPPPSIAARAVGTATSRPAVPTSTVGADNRQAALAPTLYPLSLPAWRRHGRPFDINDPRPRIAIIIVGLGLLLGHLGSDQPAAGRGDAFLRSL